MVLLLILSFATTALAQPGKYAQLGKGQMMPWSGWCFDSEAMAHILAEREGQEARCRIKLQRQAEELGAAYNLELGKLKAEMQYEVETRQDTIEALKVENLKIEIENLKLKIENLKLKTEKIENLKLKIDNLKN